jgi:hypothetical protein
VDDDVSFGSFGGDEISAVEVAIDEFDLGVLGGDFCAFVAVASHCRDLEVRIRRGNRVKSISTNVASATGTGVLLISFLPQSSKATRYR